MRLEKVELRVGVFLPSQRGDELLPISRCKLCGSLNHVEIYRRDARWNRDSEFIALRWFQNHGLGGTRARFHQDLLSHRRGGSRLRLRLRRSVRLRLRLVHLLSVVRVIGVSLGQEVELDVILLRRQDPLLKLWSILPHELRRLVHDHSHVWRRYNHPHRLRVRLQRHRARVIHLHAPLSNPSVHGRLRELHLHRANRLAMCRLARPRARKNVAAASRETRAEIRASGEI